MFSPKDKIGDWLEMYTKVMELNYWASTDCQERHLRRAGEGMDRRRRARRQGRSTLRPKQLVFATGMSGKPNMPRFQGMDTLQGRAAPLLQASRPGCLRGKKAVVIGSNNSAHDICAALWEAGADVTMVQRSTTTSCRSDPLMEIGLGALYSEQALPRRHDHRKGRSDLRLAALPDVDAVPKAGLRQDPRGRRRFLRALEKAGFMLDFGDDESGLFMKYLRRGSGYYIDVGASQLIIDGKIKLRPDRSRKSRSTGVVLDNGTEMPADVIVYATGYGSMNGWVADLVSQEMADKVGKVWGLGSDTTKDPGPWEGEQRNMWKPTQQEGLWFHGGNLHQSRHYSQFLSLQLKARMEGIPTPVYGLQTVHHKA